MSALGAYFRTHGAELTALTMQHVLLTVLALGFAVALGFPLGLWLSRRPHAAGPVLAAVSVVQTIPSLALLGVLIPLTGIGKVPAIVALVLYALLPIVRNTVIGVTTVDAAVREAAVGMGMTDRQVLARVELPLALPVVFAGVRTATVVSVGVATLAALVGGGGLGVYIFRGISLADTRLILAGAVPAAGLAVALDALLGVVEKHLSRFLRPLVVLFVAVVIFAAYRGVVAAAETRFRIAMPAEFIERADGYRGMVARYGLVADVIEMDHGLMYRALAEDRVDAVVGYSTDGEIARFDLRTVEDDKRYFPPYFAAPVAREESLARHPELRPVLDKLAGRIDERQMAALNARVELDHETPAAVASAFLRGAGFPPGPRRRRDPADVVIGSKIFAEQYVLAEMLAQLVETYTPLSVKLTTGLGGTKICFEALRKGAIDVYPEYTGTGLYAILGKLATGGAASEPSAVYADVKREFRSQFGLEWLEPFGFGNTYAVIAKPQTLERLGVHTTSGLVEALDGVRGR